MLNSRNCQSIAKTASKIIGHSILLTGKDGIVLGSSDQERVGTLHEASLEVIRSGQQAYHDEEQVKAYRGTRPGTTIPIIINNEVVGSIGITGKPEDISKYGILIKKLAEVFLKDQLEMESVKLLEQSRQNLLRHIITYDPNTMDEKLVLNHGRILGCDLLLPRAAVMIEVANAQKAKTKKMDSLDFSLISFNNAQPYMQHYSIIKHIFNHDQDLHIFLGNNEYIVFSYLGAKPQKECDSVLHTELNKKCNKLVAQFASKGISAWVGIGDKANSLKELKDSYNDANQAIYIAKRSMDSGVQYINDLYLEKLILNIPDSICKCIYDENIGQIKDIKDKNDFINIIICWCENKFNFTQTAKSLNMHKNTLLYRFAKIKKTMGLDLYDFNKVIAIYLVIKRYKVNELL